MEAGTLRCAKEGLCATCFAKATDKCSKCKQRWYCSQVCQVKIAPEKTTLVLG
eukprot:symbB.v1.2.039835.t1/scaffold6818.1/size15291/1